MGEDERTVGDREARVRAEAYEAGSSTGVPDDVWDLLREHRVLLKGPITTPQGGGYKSVNVTLRKSLGLCSSRWADTVERAIAI